LISVIWALGMLAPALVLDDTRGAASREGPDQTCADQQNGDHRAGEAFAGA
jgi:hypothetical protein